MLTVEHRWFGGPQLLYEHKDYLPQGKCTVHEKRSDKCLTEIVKPEMTFVLEVSQPLMNPLNCTSCNRLRRVTQWVRRFAHNLLDRLGEETRLILTDSEVERAGKLWVKQAEEKQFL